MNKNKIKKFNILDLATNTIYRMQEVDEICFTRNNILSVTLKNGTFLKGSIKLTPSDY